MKNTEPILYLEDSYLKEFDSVVVEVFNERSVVLDRTAFYPTSGGQPNDTGSIIAGSERYHLVSCSKSDGKIVHEIDRPGMKIGDTVRCAIDWDRRYRLMRMHTAAHIISGLIHKETGALITGNRLDLEKSRIDFSLEEYSPEKMQGFIDKANEVVGQDIPVKISSMTREEAERTPGIAKLAKGLPEGISIIRTLNIEGVDYQADGGTHVHSTKEVGRISLVKTENKGKDNRRLHFTLE